MSNLPGSRTEPGLRMRSPRRFAPRDDRIGGVMPMPGSTLSTALPGQDQNPAREEPCEGYTPWLPVQTCEINVETQ